MKRIFSILILLVFMQTLQAQTSVWKVTKADKVMYFASDFGKMKKEYYPLPQQYYVAYNASDILVLNDDRFNSRTTEIIDQNKLPNGQTLKTFLDAKTYQRFDSLCIFYKVDLTSLEEYDPLYATIFIDIEMNKNADYNANTIANYFRLRTERAKKETKYLLSFVNDSSYYQVANYETKIKIINKALTDLKEDKKAQKSYYKNWLKGKTETVESRLKEIETKELGFYNFEIKQKNVQLIENLQPYLETEKVIFVLLSRLNLLGKDGIFQYLINNNFTIEQL